VLTKSPSAANRNPAPTPISRPKDSDASLVLAVRADDEAAFVTLAGRYQWLVDRMARTYWLPGGDEDDLRQEALLGLLRACRDYRPERAAFVGFAKLAVERTVITAVHAATRRKHETLNGAVSLDAPLPDADLDGATLGDVVAGGRDPVDDVIATERRREFMVRAAELTSQLSDLERSALDARRDGISYARTALRLGVSVKRVDNALQRARRKAAAVCELEAAA